MAKKTIITAVTANPLVSALINFSAHVVPLNSKAVMPDGSLADRAAILKALNLNPNTPPDAWLTIAACGSNASALNMKTAKELVAKGKLDKALLGQITGK